MKGLAQLAGDRTGFAGADRAAIALDDGDHFGSRAGEETFVSGVNIVPGQGRFAERDLCLLSQLDDGVARNAFENACLGRGDRKSTRLNSSHGYISYAVFCLKKKKDKNHDDAPRVDTLKHI